MRATLTLQNYRCFVEPITIELSSGFTAFVGVNNAGKSAIMRFLLEFRELFRRIGRNGNFLNALQTLDALGRPNNVDDGQEVFSNLNSRPINFSFDFLHEVTPNYLQPIKVSITVNRDFTWRAVIITTNGQIDLGGANPGFSPTSMLTNADRHLCDLTETFRLAQLLSDTMYIGPFRNAINVGSNTTYLDIQVGQAFIQQFRNMKTGPARQDNLAILALTDQIKHIFRFTDLSIDASADTTSLHLTINGRPYKQHELGSGLIQFVLVLANASIRRPQLILIDEPELNLHPSLQLDFLTTLGSYAGVGTWFSTHSVGLARSAAEQVYSVVKRRDGDSIVRPLAGTPRLAEFLGEMSFSSHKELGFEKLLLVEGPTEVKVFQHILRSMGKDHKILPLPLHGRMPLADDLEEILRITTNVSAVIDSERTAEGAPLGQDRQRFLDLCVDKGIHCKILDRRATENYFPDAMVKSIFGNDYRGLTPFEKLADARPHWNKIDNWKLALAWPMEEVRATDLGQFLGEL